MIGDPLIITVTLAQLCLVAGAWAHLLSRIARVETRISYLYDELRDARHRSGQERTRRTD